MSFVLKYAKTVAFVAGILSVLSFAPFYYTVAGFIGFSIFLFLLLSIDDCKKLFGIGYSFGFSHFAFGLSWVGNALLIEPEKFGWLYPITLIAAGGFFGLFVAVPAWLTKFAERYWQKWVVFAAWFVIFEWIRSFLFTGFPWNLAGYTLAFDDRLIQAAAFGGTYFLSLVCVLAYMVWGLWLNQKNIKVLLFCLIWTVVSLGGLWGFGWYRLNKAQVLEEDTVVRIVQPSIPQQIKWKRDVLEDNFSTYLQLSSSEGEVKPDIIIWGETASPFVLDTDDDHRKQVATVIPDNGYLVTGMVSYHLREGKYVPHNSMAVLSSSGEIAAYYHKSHLVPFGEYIPLRRYLPSFIQPVANAIGTFGQGAGPQKIKLSGIPSFGGIICYEIIFPHEVVNQRQRPDFLINLTNDGWYGYSPGPFQHWAATRLRAVEEGITIVRAANNGISGLINGYGQVKAMLPLDYTGVLDVRLDKSLTCSTFYSLFGNGVILTFCLLLLFLGSIKIRNGRFCLRFVR